MEQVPETLDDLLYRCTVRVDIGTKPKGTGFFVAPGLILTCAHVVKGETEQQRSAQPVEAYWHWGGQHFSAQIQEFLPNPYPDLALLSIDDLPEHPCVYLSRDIRLDDKLYSYGYVEGYPNGDPAYFDYEGLSRDPDLLKLKNAQARHGLSGAPLLNRRTDAVCGIVKKSRNTRSGLGGRAVPTSTIILSFNELPALQREFHERDKTWSALMNDGREPQHALLDEYENWISQQIDEGLDRDPEEYGRIRVSARRRTKRVLKRLDRDHKKDLLEFLWEQQLIRRDEGIVDGRKREAHVVGLSGADLRNANLRYITLEGAALDGAILENADLRHAKLSGTNLGGAYLSGADLRGANMSKASLREAQLQRKDELNLRGADLTDADLSGADLTDAKVSNEQLATCRSLEGATMPDGTLHP